MFEIELLSYEQRIDFRRYGFPEYQIESKDIRQEIEKHLNYVMEPINVDKLKNKQFSYEEGQRIVKKLKDVAIMLLGQYEMRGTLDILIGDLERKKAITVDRKRSTELYFIFIQSIMENGKFAAQHGD